MSIQADVAHSGSPGVLLAWPQSYLTSGCHHGVAFQRIGTGIGTRVCRDVHRRTHLYRPAGVGPGLIERQLTALPRFYGPETSQTKEGADGVEPKRRGRSHLGAAPYGCSFYRGVSLACYLGANCVDSECPVARDIIYLCGACFPSCGNSANHAHRAGFRYGYASARGVYFRATGDGREA